MRVLQARSDGTTDTCSRLRGVVFLLMATALIACADIDEARSPHVADSAVGPKTTVDCDFNDVVFDANFPTGELDGCSKSEDGFYVLRFDPENAPINPSPWYAFRVRSSSEQEISVRLTYSLHRHRYWPKLSADGKHWQRASVGSVSLDAETGTASLRLRVGSTPLFVAGQEILASEDYDDWTRSMAEGDVFERLLFGKSAQGRDIWKLEFDAGTGRYVAFIGRQHPPETTGGLALKHYVERISEMDPLAVTFRDQFGIVVVPNLNPDGVDLGYWRHSTGGVDLNRDWGPFTQPETQLMRDELERFSPVGGDSLFLFLDFHSTGKDVLYTQPPNLQTVPVDFTSRWVAGLQQALSQSVPGYPVTVEPGHNLDLPTSRNYVFARYRAPSITFEVGDESDRKFIRTYARTAAEQMMKLLLEYL
ncbi:MAG: M14 family metallopeptidase [Pseudomonadota bacterium]